MGELSPEDVRFLLVHHTAGTTDYAEDSVADQIRQVYAFHTGTKGWPDVCYNFFVDRYGSVWEGRAGSLAGPVKADATGGNQGFAQLVCLIGNYHENEPSTAMLESLVHLLAWLGEREGLNLTPGATTSFVSRGSNRWPEGTEVTARIISGHRDMSQTVCPGDYVYPLLESSVPSRIVQLRTTTATTTLPATTVAFSTVPAAPPSTTPIGNISTTLTTAAATPIEPPRSGTAPQVAPPTSHADLRPTRGSVDSKAPSTALVGGALALGGGAVCLGALIAARAQRHGREPIDGSSHQPQR